MTTSEEIAAVEQQFIPSHKSAPPKIARYRPAQRADWDPDATYRVDDYGFEMCSHPSCPNHASNYSGRCTDHGGVWPSGLSRWVALEMGYNTVEELDDEELTKAVTKAINGVPIRRHKRIPVDLYHKAVNELYKRHDEKLRGMLDDALNTMYGIMTNPEAAHGDRIKAATWIYERVRGKPQEQIRVEIDAKPWEQVLSGVARKSQNESRAERGLEPIDAEIVPLGSTDAEQGAKSPYGGAEAGETPLVQGPAGEHLSLIPGTAEYAARKQRIADAKARLVTDAEPS